MVEKKSLLLLGGLVSITFLGSSLPSLGGELLKLKWKRYVGKKNYAYTCQPLIWKDRIYHATNGDKNNKQDSYDRFYAFDKNGNLLWSFKWNYDLDGVVANDRFVAFTSDDGWVFVFDHKGNLLWKKRVSNTWNLFFSTVDLNGDGYPDLVVGSRDGYLYALNGENGSLRKFKIGKYIWSSPAIGDVDGDGKLEVVFGSGDGYLYALNGENGSLLWKFKTGNWIVSLLRELKIVNWIGSLPLWNWELKTGNWIGSSPAIADIDGDGKLEVVFGSGDHYLYALNGEDGSLLWKFKTGGAIWTSPAIADIDGDGRLEVVFGSEDNYLYALNGEDGSLLWKFKTGFFVNSSPAIADIDGDRKLEVVFGSYDHNLYVLNGEDGSLLWKFKTGNWIASSPAIGDVDGNGKLDVAVASFDGYLYLFEATKRGGRVVWSRWHGDAEGTGNYKNAYFFGITNTKRRNLFVWKPPKDLTFLQWGKNYYLPKGEKLVLITDYYGNARILPSFYGSVLKVPPVWDKLKLELPDTVEGIVNYTYPPYGEIYIYGSTPSEVKSVYLNGESIAFTPLEGGYITEPIDGNLNALRNFTVKVELKNGQSFYYTCGIVKGLKVECTKLPVLVPTF